MANNRFTLAHGIAVLAGVLTLGLAGTALAFHDGGVAHCDGCHTVHNTAENPVNDCSDGQPNCTAATENTLLLKGTDQSSTCLNCHSIPGRSYNILSSDGSSWTPGGDYFWLTQSYSNVVRGNTVTSVPDNTGHNVIAVDYGLTQDGINAVSPGGGYSAANLRCTSCHDPHGQSLGGTLTSQDPISVSGSYGATPAVGTRAGNYRLLGGTLYLGTAAPIALTAGFGETDTEHPAYSEGMAEWCGTCHGDYVNGINQTKHPAANTATLGAGIQANYNSYVTSGDFSGTSVDSFTALVQFERQETDQAVLLGEVTSEAGPDATDNVMCLTCHRAHASAFNNAVRWDSETELLKDSVPNAANLTAMGAVANAAYYGRVIDTEFSEFQRSLCNKCHVKD